MRWRRRIYRGLVLVGAIGLGGCVHAPVLRCAPGMQQSQGQCLPVPTIVFRQCMEAFRTQAVERNNGREFELEGAGSRVGKAKVRSVKHDSERTEYADMPAQDVPEAIAECRRQEEVARVGELHKAWAAAKRAAEHAAGAEALAQRASENAQRAERQRAKLERALGDVQGQLAVTLATLDETRTALRDKLPCTAGDWERCVIKAAAAHEREDFADAHAKYALACEGGHARACGDWGLMFEHGQGIAPSPTEAAIRYARGCELVDAESCVSLGVLVEHGSGVALDPQRAAVLYGKACKTGNLRGCTGRARIYEAQGDPVRAAKLLRRACDGAHAPACLSLGYLREEGRGVERDLSRAARRYREACEGALAAACVRLGRMREEGRGLAQDSARALTRYQQACTAGEPAGCDAADRLSRLDAPTQNPIRPSGWTM